MSKKNQRPEVPDSLLETAMTIVSPPQDASGAKEASDGADRKHLTEVTISEPAAAKDAPEPSGEEEIEATIPMSQSRHTAHTELMDTPPSGERSVIGDLLPGDRVERYVIVKRLGQGGMGSVYLARHETLGVFRAIKVLSGALYQRGKEFTRRFIQEAKIASSISDPNIVNVLDVGEDPDRSFCYIIMEYVDGGTVRDVLRRIPRLSELHAMVIAEAVAVALNAAAEQKIVHRDIKPDNIMLTRRGEVKLADLGIAKNTDDNVQLTKSHVMMGTPAYLAPEQAQDAHSVDVRADIYSLGATLFEMLTGQIPYPGKSTYDILRKLVSEPVPDPRSIVDTISAPTARLVMRMLAKDAKQRPKSAMELLKEIHKLNSLPANIDTRKCIRELLEQSGEGNYSAASLTSATGNAVSSWFARHVLLRMETALRRVPMFATMLDAMQRNLVLSYILLALIVLLLLGLPATWYFTRGSRVQMVKDTDFVTVVPEVPQTVDVPEVPAVVPEVPPAPPVVKAPEKPAPAAPAVKAPEVPTAKKPQTPAAGEVSPAKPETPAPEVKRPEPPAPPPKPASRPAVKPPAPKPPAPKPPVAAPRPAEVRKIGFSAEIAPAGAEVILRNEAGRVVERRQAPAGRRMEFSVPAGQYKLEVTAPGYRAESREFPLSESRAISGVKIELQREVASCRVDFYGSLQLLEYLRKRGIEVRVDGGEWKKTGEIPLKLELSRAAHTIEIRGEGIYPVSKSWTIESDQKRSAVEIYPQEKEAVLEIVPEVEGKVRINISGIWEDLRRNVAVSPFKEIALRWKIGDGAEQVTNIPKLDPGSVRKVVLKERKAANYPGAEEFAEGEALVKSGDYGPATEKLNAAAEKGNPEAMYLLGWMAEAGKGRWFANDKEALEHYRKAAEPPYEYAKAQFKMGNFLENGRGGLSRDREAALNWYRKAAAKKDPDALFQLAMVYRDSSDPGDQTKMFEALSQAAELGHLEAQYQLGYCYENGRGVPTSMDRARFWYGKAAERGHGTAASRLKVLE